MNALTFIRRADLPARDRITDEDRAEAEAFITQAFDNNPKVCRTWLAMHRPSLIRQAVTAEMQKREHREWKEKFNG